MPTPDTPVDPPEWRVEPEFRDTYRAYAADPSPTNAGGLLKAVEPVLRMGVATYGGGDSPIIRGHARRIAVESLPGYDPTRASLKTHLMSRLQGLQRHAARRDRHLSVPERLLLDRARVHAATATLTDDLGREPSDAELSDYARISTARLAAIRSYAPAVASGALAASAAAIGREAPADAVVDGPDGGLRRAELLYPDLSPPDQAILERALGLRGRDRQSHREIAASLGISASAVTQRAARIQARLDELADMGIL